MNATITVNVHTEDTVHLTALNMSLLNAPAETELPEPAMAVLTGQNVALTNTLIVLRMLRWITALF